MKRLDVERFASLAESELLRFGVPGMALGVVVDGEVVLERGFGVRSLASGLPVTAQTQFAIGSSTKAFTGTLCAALVEQGRLEWDEPVRRYLPDFAVADPIVSDQLTLRDLLCHRSGMGRHELAWYGNYGISEAELVHRLRHLPMTAPLRQVWQYNNLGYVVAGHLAGSVLGTTWQDAVRELLLEPLGMADSGVSVPAARARDDVADAYLTRDDVPVEVAWRDIGLGAAAGAINSTAADMVRWLGLNLGAAWVPASVGDAQLREVRTPSMLMPSVFPWDENRFLGYGLGWMVETHRGMLTVHHGGNIDGLTAFVTFAPELRSGLIGLANLHATWAPMALAAHLYDELLGLPSLPWGERFRENEQKARATLTEGTTRPSVPARPAAHALSEYAGVYEHPGYGALVVAVAGDALSLRLNDLELSFAHQHGEVWLAEYPVLQLTFDVAFRADFRSRVTQLVTNVERTVPPLVFDRRP
ncbi:MAG: hypothetical protein QOE05_2997 [Actinomycetota bacterium]|nr:hypothetical protein [Actinomycetota bacterium]